MVSPKLAVAFAALLGLAVVPGGLADEPVVEYHACVLQLGGTLRMVAEPTECIPGEGAMTWSRQGPQGPAGEQGPTGPAGPQGEAGPQGPAGDSAWTTAANGIAYMGGRVGVGTTTAQGQFQVVGGAGPAGSQSDPDAGVAFVVGQRPDAHVRFGYVPGQYAWMQGGGGSGAYPVAINPLGGNLGIGTTAPTATLDVNGPIRLRDSAAVPCDADHGGTLRFVAGGSGVADALQVCMKDASDLYAWRVLVSA